jgi:hypothetical protein
MMAFKVTRLSAHKEAMAWLADPYGDGRPPSRPLV